jgi:NTP pyrophosphatase (non-canonical NTP hydrolase)
MNSRITELVFDSPNPAALARFWCEVLGFEVIEDDDDGAVAIGPPGQPEKGPLPILVFNVTEDPRPKKLPLHIDVNAIESTQEEELQRLLALGATTADIGQTGEESWHVLRDPDGNEFCLLRSTVAPLGSLAELPAVAAQIAGHLNDAGFAEQPHLRQALALAEEAGEFVGAVRRHYGMARRTGSKADVEAELADVVITAFVTAHEMDINLESAINEKLAVIFNRGWREGSIDAGEQAKDAAGE